MNFNDPMPYSYYSGPRDGRADHIRHVAGWMELVSESPAAAKQYEDDDIWAAEREEEQEREYLRQKPIMLSDDKED